MYVYDPRIKTDEGILRLCKEIKDRWGGTMTPPTQYRLNDAWNKIKKAEVSCFPFCMYLIQGVQYTIYCTRYT